ncbi:MAG: 4Fe-4S binding protein, partial [Firmicutes bacterium]|nr:4Fe-4S binding protein [Bacillota bacterium]
MPQRPCAYVACSISTAGSEGSGACTAGCEGCGLCSVVCPKGAVRTSGRLPSIDPDLCDGCGVCARSCPRNLIHI